MKNSVKAKIIEIVATVLCVGAPLVTTLTQFPTWIAKSVEATMSGIAVVIGLVSAVPIVRLFKSRFKRTPSAWLIWLILYILAEVLSNVLDQMKAVFLVAIIASLVGAGLFRISNFIAIKPDT